MEMSMLRHRIQMLFDTVKNTHDCDPKRGVERAYQAPLMAALAAVDLTPERMRILTACASPTLKRLFIEANDQKMRVRSLSYAFADATVKALQIISNGLYFSALETSPKSETITFKGLLRLEASLEDVIDNFNLLLENQTHQLRDSIVFRILSAYQHEVLPETRALIEAEAEFLGLDAAELALKRREVRQGLGSGAEHLCPIPADSWHAAAPA